MTEEIVCEYEEVIPFDESPPALCNRPARWHCTMDGLLRCDEHAHSAACCSQVVSEDETETKA